MSGIGVQAAGVSPAGLGDAATATAQSGSVFKDSSTRRQLDCRRINATTGQYEFGTDGRIVGDTTVRQLVKLAFKTSLGTATDSTLGQNFFAIKDITNDIEQQVRTRSAEALRRMTDARLVELVDTRVERSASGALLVTVLFRDLTTGEQEEITI